MDTRQNKILPFYIASLVACHSKEKLANTLAICTSSVVRCLFMRFAHFCSSLLMVDF